MIKVYFDGVCGHCSKEIEYYKTIAPSNSFKWIDVASNPNAMIDYNIPQSQALLYLHVANEKNELYVGSEAFALIWKNLPRWKILGYIISLPCIKVLAKKIYVLFAKRRFNKSQHCQMASKTLAPDEKRTANL